VELTRAWVASATGGTLAGGGDPERPGEGIAFDSRTVVPGQVFVALRGDRDGHAFVPDAYERGAAFVVVERPVPGVPAVVVADTGRALFDLAGAARARLVTARTVGITGSVGKTSTKDLIAAALGAHLRTHAAPASFNNEIGVPYTVLGAPLGTEVLVVELGARFAGNIAELSALVEPEIGIITNIGIVHAEHLGGPEGVARVKGELLDALPAHGLAVLDATCAGSASQRHRSAAPVVTVGTGSDADVQVTAAALDDELRASFDLRTPWGSGRIALAVRGEHQVTNAAMAATVALRLGVPFAGVTEALAGAAGPAWRMQVVDTVHGVRVINDAYNASPVAVMAAIRALTAMAARGRRIAVLGEMLELGALGDAEHARVGEAVARAPVDVLVTVGVATTPLVEAARRARADLTILRTADAAEAAAVVATLVRPGDLVLVKASRAVGLEIVVDVLAESAA